MRASVTSRGGVHLVRKKNDEADSTGRIPLKIVDNNAEFQEQVKPEYRPRP
jgi:hypothetical protein